MNGFLAKYKNKIFFRLLAVNFCILTALVFVYQVVSYLYFNQSYHDKVKAALQQNALQTKYLLDTSIVKGHYEVLETYFNSALHLDSALDIFLTNKPISSTDILNISDSLNKIIYINNHIRKFKVYSPKNHLMFVNGNVYYLNSLKDGGKSWGEMAIFDKLLNSGTRQQWSYDETTRMISHTITLPFYSFNNTIDSAICMDIGIESFLDTVGDTFALTVLQGDGSILYTPSPLDSNQEYQGVIAEMHTAGETDSLHQVKRQHTSVLQWITKSDYAELYYVFTLPNQDNSFFLALLGIACLNIAVLVMFLLISYLMTKKIHTPLEKIIASAKDAMRSGAPAFVNNDYNILDTTVKDVTVLRDRMGSNSQLIYETLVRMLLDGSFDGELFVSNYKLCNIQFCYDLVFALIIKMRTGTSEQVVGLTESLRGSFDGFDVYPVYDANSHNIRAVVNAVAGGYDVAIETIQKQLATGTNLSFQLFAGNFYDLHEVNISMSMREARSIYEYSYIMEDRAVLCHSMFTNITLTPMGDHVGRLDSIEKALQNRNLEVAQEKSTEYLLSLKSYEYDISDIKKMALDLIFCIKTTVSQFSSLVCQSASELSTSSLCDSIDLLLVQMNEVVFPDIRNYLELIKNDVSLESQIIKVIHETPYEVITLDYIASCLNMRSSAFSKTFKAMINMNFTDYVRNLKLEYAAKLLEENKLSIKDISAKLGYSTSHYFIRIFKERYSCTPKQYQNMRVAEQLKQIHEAKKP